MAMSGQEEPRYVLVESDRFEADLDRDVLTDV